MKRLLVLAAGLVAAAAPAFASPRLPTTVKPTRYAITFEPDLSKATFKGEESIDVTIGQATRQVTLNAIELVIGEATAKVGGKSWPARVSYDEKAETATLSFTDELPAGAARLELAFTGKLNDKLHGFYAAESDGHKFAFTQFEATDARRAYPCFDEPAFKARFQVTAVIDPSDRAVSNGAIVEEKLDPAHHKKVVKFSETLPMSSYLVALAVGPLVEVKGHAKPGKPPIRVWTPPGKEKLAGFALKESEQLLDKLGNYFGIPYPYGKLDLVAVPDFAAGAMENTGAIFFRETALLVDEETASADHRHGVSMTIAHEMAHQWFGDLVTMAWWDDLWLNEAFATWMENKVVDQLHPDWKIWLDFEQGKSYALGLDALGATHPIRTPVSSPEQANEQFDGITYSKGSSVLRMLEMWLGEPAFRKGVSSYVKAHEHGNATATDLFQALATASGQPVAEVATSWFEQPGFPLVEVKASCQDDHTVLDLSQSRFFAGGHKPGVMYKQQKWLVPICLRSHEGTQCTLLDKPRATVTLNASGCGWVEANAHHAGFYRVAYTPAALAELGKVAEAQLDPAERLALVDDDWSLVRAGAAPLTSWLDLVEKLKGETTPEVNDEVAKGLGFLEQYVLAEPDRPLFNQLVEELFRPLFVKLGWQPRAGESDLQKSLRATVLETLGQVGRSTEVLDGAKERLAGYLAKPASVDGSVAGALVALNAFAGGNEVYDRFVDRMRASHEPEERARFMSSLARFQDPKLVARTLDLTLTRDIRVQDVSRLLGGMLRENASRPATWQFIKSHFAQLKAKAPPYGFDRLVGATGAFCDEASQKDVYAFFTDPSHKVESSERALKLSQESIRLCSDLRTREAAQLSAWLKARAPKHASR